MKLDKFQLIQEIVTKKNSENENLTRCGGYKDQNLTLMHIFPCLT